MIKKQILFTLFVLLTFGLSAENTITYVSPDSIKYSVDLDEIEIVNCNTQLVKIKNEIL